MRLSYWGHLSQAEIAQRLGISQMHVSRLLARSLARFQEQLGENPLGA
jgi:RNA polymerase sigma-B factor